MIANLNNKLHTPMWLFILLGSVLILRIPSFFLPYSYGDELIYLTLGEAIRQGVPLYSEIHDNKPPLLYVTAAIAGNLFWFKAILAVWSLTTIYIFWKLTEILLPSKNKDTKGWLPKNQTIQAFATLIFAILTTIPLLEGHIANAENFMIGPTILGFYLLLSRKVTTKNLILSGGLFSIAALYKIPAAFDVPAIVFYWLCTQKNINKKSILMIIKRIILLSVGFLIPIVLTFIWYYFQGAFKEYLVAAFLQNFGYLSSWRPDDVQKPFLEKNGPLLIRVAVTALAGCLLFWKRKLVSKHFVFTSFWLFLTLFAVSLSERPYPHYLLQSVGPIAILFATLFTSTRMEQVYSIIPLFFVFLVPYYFHFWHYETVSYYQRFANLITNQVSTEEYLKSFGDQVPINYRVASKVVALTKPEEKVFVWGDGVAIYALSRRLPPIKYVADYHIKDFSSYIEVVNKLKTSMPAYIVLLPGAEPSQELNYLIKVNYAKIDEGDKYQIWKLLGPKVRSLLSF